MESELLQEMKRMNGALDKQLRPTAGDHYVECGGFRYNTKKGNISGNTAQIMFILSVGDEFPADIVIKKRIKNRELAAKATKLFGSLPSIVPGLHEEAAADLMATASVRMKSPNAEVVQLLLDVPMMQRSKQYYLKKIEKFLQSCKEPAGMCIYITSKLAVLRSSVIKLLLQPHSTTRVTVKKAVVTGASKMAPSASKRSSTFTGNIAQANLSRSYQTAVTLGTG